MTEAVPAGRFPGWRVVTAGCVAMTATSGIGFYGLAVYLNALSNERGWSIGSISAAVGLFFLASGFAGLATARLLARYDVRWVVAAGGLLGAVTLVGLGRVERVWQVYLVYVVFAFGHAMAGLIPSTTVVTRWFHTKRSTALSIASTGLSLGGILITPLSKWLIDHHGLATVTPWLAAAWVIGIVPITLAWMLPSPEPYGWAPDGVRRDASTPATPPAGAPYSDAVRSRFFVLLTIAYVLVMGSQVGGLQHLVKLSTERVGVGAATAATSVVAAMSVIGRLTGGQVARRVSLTRMVVVLALGQAAALALLSVVETTATLFIAIGMFGATIGNLLMLHPLVVAEAFGVREYLRIFSRSQFFMFLGTAAGPYLVGWLHDNHGGYATAYVVVSVIAIAGAALIATAGSERAIAASWGDPSVAPDQRGRASAAAAASARQSGE